MMLHCVKRPHDPQAYSGCLVMMFLYLIFDALIILRLQDLFLILCWNKGWIPFLFSFALGYSLRPRYIRWRKRVATTAAHPTTFCSCWMTVADKCDQEGTKQLNIYIVYRKTHFSKHDQLCLVITLNHHLIFRLSLIERCVSEMCIFSWIPKIAMAVGYEGLAKEGI